MRAHARKIGIILGSLVALSLLPWALASCTTLITPQAALSDPVEVFVVDHGRTTSLVVPASDGRLLRYAYGDWDWYALGKHGIWHAITALLWPTQGALGRERLEGPATIENVRHQVPHPEEIHCVPVERARLLAFVRRMEALYDSGRDSEVSNPEIGMSFVHHPQAYTAFQNSNHAVASWLRELGSTTRGLSFGANWRVAAIRRAKSNSAAGADTYSHECGEAVGV
jgi:hypothetical protein